MYNVKFNKAAKVRGEALMLFLTALPTGKSSRAKVLENHGVVPQVGQWHDIENTVKAYHEIKEKVGEQTLFMLGKGVATSVPFQPGTDLKHALIGINFGYHMNHSLNGKAMFDPKTKVLQNGIGAYQFVSFDEVAKRAIIKCTNPYPSKLDEGVLMQVLRMVKPEGSIKQHVELDKTKEMRDKGGASCTFILTW
ncbi:MAG: hypothetical protein OCD76_22890 [Reichenbachiella sp.]